MAFLWTVLKCGTYTYTEYKKLRLYQTMKEHFICFRSYFYYLTIQSYCKQLNSMNLTSLQQHCGNLKIWFCLVLLDIWQPSHSQPNSNHQLKLLYESTQLVKLSTKTNRPKHEPPRKEIASFNLSDKTSGTRWWHLPFPCCLWIWSS